MLFSRSEKDGDTVVHMLASALRRDISFGTLLPDQKLKIEALRQRYGGSNHSMRETLRLLSAEGLVEATAQRGFRVTSATEDDLRDINLVRKELERVALGLAIAQGDTDYEGRVIAAHHALRKAEDRVAAAPDDLNALEWDEACRGFSAALISACGSPRLQDLQRKFFDQSRRFRLAQLREGRLDFNARRARQEALMQAVLARDPERAEALLAQDIDEDFKTNSQTG
ncbi:GntR family transcriptional regulator [Pseudooceanicola sp. MF1-13]|uniref:GntR family transcriptional regulator n=1 Tax=Pseudooceanicola sp. MF1-13 TaxID=3379095 RepID=UPI003892B487